MALTDTSTPALGEVTLKVSNGGRTAQFDRFLSYEYTEDYLSPSDASSFEIDEKELSAEDAQVLVAGAKYTISINGNPQSTGIVDEVASNVERGTGTTVRVECRDWLAPAVDAQVDPNQRFAASLTLEQFVQQNYAPFGVTVVATDNIANRNVMTGRIYGDKTTKKGKLSKPALLHKEKPYPNEGVFAFTSRVSQRFGLWIRPAVDGKAVILGKPDFDQAPRYGLQLSYGTDSLSNNVEKGHFCRSRKDQPSILYAGAVGGGGEFARSQIKSGIGNPVVDADNSAIIDANPSIKLVQVPALTAAFPAFVEGFPRAAFLYDPESHTKAELDAFLLRELSIRMRKALTARYEIMGHSLNGQPVAIDTIVNVNDQRPTVKWQGPLWVLGRKFSKSAASGTRTTLELILPGALVF
jgi:prophage tail gpP-like protein